jgi:hypothetical protein
MWIVWQYSTGAWPALMWPGFAGLSSKASYYHCWVIFPVTNLIAMMNIFERYSPDVEVHIVSRTKTSWCISPWFSFHCHMGKGVHHAEFKNTSLHLANKERTNFVHKIVEPIGDKGLINWTGASRMQSKSSSSVVSLTLLSLWVTFHLLNHECSYCWLQYVCCQIPTRNRHKSYWVGVVTNFLMLVLTS